MSQQLAERRKARALTYFMIAGAMVLITAISLGIQNRGSQPSSLSGPVVPGLAETISSGQRITIVSADATYRIERAQRGDQAVWVMRDRGDYPVLASRLAQLTQGLANLRYTRRMTSSSTRHARLGVGDPRQGGRGILVQIEGDRGALLVNLILGVEPTGGVYVRRPDEEQVWAVEGDLPPLRSVAAWLDLTPLALESARLARVEVTPPEGRAYILAREAPNTAWAIAAPALQPLAETTVRATAERLTALEPVDVQEAPAIQGAPRARVRATTFDGIVIDAELIEVDGRLWMKLVARASAPEQEAAAQAINNRSAGWAYALSEQEAASLVAPLSSLVPGAN